MPPDGSFQFPIDADVYTPASTPPIFVSAAERAVLSLDPEGDRFYGLLPGTNGTGPTMRRACVPADYQWLTSEGKPALGPTLVPTADSDLVQNQWGFHASHVRSAR